MRPKQSLDAPSQATTDIIIKLLRRRKSGAMETDFSARYIAVHGLHMVFKGLASRWRQDRIIGYVKYVQQPRLGWQVWKMERVYSSVLRLFSMYTCGTSAPFPCYPPLGATGKGRTGAILPLRSTPVLALPWHAVEVNPPPPPSKSPTRPVR